jgi:hypothetical protein
VQIPANPREVGAQVGQRLGGREPVLALPEELAKLVLGNVARVDGSQRLVLLFQNSHARRVGIAPLHFEPARIEGAVGRRSVAAPGDGDLRAVFGIGVGGEHHPHVPEVMEGRAGKRELVGGRLDPA